MHQPTTKPLLAPHGVWRPWAFALALSTLLMATPLSSQAQPRQLRSTGSGPWRSVSWVNINDPTDTQPPGAQDTAFIQPGHTVTLEGFRPQEQLVAHLNVYGTLIMRQESPQAAPSTLRVQSLIVRNAGHLLVEGDHTLIFKGQPILDARPDQASVLATHPGAKVTVRGWTLLDDGVVSEVIEERGARMTLKQTGASWRPGQWSGRRLKLLSGLGRLWSFTVIDNTADTVTVNLNSRGAAPVGDRFQATLSPTDPRALEVRAHIVAPDPRGHRGHLMTGRWLINDDGDAHLIVAAHDGGQDAADTLVLWPPPRPGAATRWRLSHRVAPGDRFQISAPATLTVPQPDRLPNYNPDLTFSLNFGDQSSVHLEHLLIDQGSLDVRDVDQNDPAESFRARDVEIAHANAACVAHFKRVRGLTLEHFHLRDIHPGNDEEAFGGLWPGGQQRGHGLCHYGADGVLRDNLLTNLNDDMLYVSNSENMRVEDNIALNSGIFHGDSHENLTFFRVQGDNLVRANLLAGASTTLLVSELTTDTRIDVEDNILIQDQSALLLSHRHSDPAPGEGRLHLRNNLLIGASPRRVIVDGRDLQTSMQGNLLVDVALDHVTSAAENISLAWRAHSAPLVADPGHLTSNLLALPTLTAQRPLVVLNEPSDHAIITHNTLDAGQGMGVVWGRGASAERLADNLIIAAQAAFAAPEMTPVNVADGTLGAPDVAHNLTNAALFIGRPWPTIKEDNSVSDVAFEDDDLYTLPKDSPAFEDDTLQGYINAGMPNPEALPLTVWAPALRHAHCSVIDDCASAPRDPRENPDQPDWWDELRDTDGTSTTTTTRNRARGCHLASPHTSHAGPWRLLAGLLGLAALLRLSARRTPSRR